MLYRLINHRAGFCRNAFFEQFLLSSCLLPHLQWQLTFNLSEWVIQFQDSQFYLHISIMCSKSSEILDCRIVVRKYVLVSRPSRWCQKGERTVVHSPMLSISKEVSHVPVRCYRGEASNSVCLLPKNDIEKDWSGIYDKALVDKTTLSVGKRSVRLIVPCSRWFLSCWTWFYQ